jgi:hypothetical protein
MLLLELMSELGFMDGLQLRYDHGIELVVFYINYNRENPAVTQSGMLISVGLLRSGFRDTEGPRTISPLSRRRDFYLDEPTSLEGIEAYLNEMFVKCESR